MYSQLSATLHSSKTLLGVPPPHTEDNSSCNVKPTEIGNEIINIESLVSKNRDTTHKGRASSPGTSPLKTLHIHHHYMHEQDWVLQIQSVITAKTQMHNRTCLHVPSRARITQGHTHHIRSLKHFCERSVEMVDFFRTVSINYTFFTLI